MIRILFYMLAFTAALHAEAKQTIEASSLKEHANQESLEISDTPLDSEPLNNLPKQGEKEDSTEIEDSEFKKCQTFYLPFDLLSVSGKTHWALANALHAMDPHIQEIHQPPESLFTL